MLPWTRISSRSVWEFQQRPDPPTEENQTDRRVHRVTFPWPEGVLDELLPQAPNNFRGQRGGGATHPNDTTNDVYGRGLGGARGNPVFKLFKYALCHRRIHLWGFGTSLWSHPALVCELQGIRGWSAFKLHPRSDDWYLLPISQPKIHVPPRPGTQ